jgi:four helix bundle protein
MRNFRNFEIWQKGIELVKQVYLLSKNLPENERFGLISQLQRASVSYPSNVAEGSSRNSDLEFKRFLEIALGSLFEIETQLIIIKELQYLKNENELLSLLKNISELQKKTNAFITKLK